MDKGCSLNAYKTSLSKERRTESGSGVKVAKHARGFSGEKSRTVRNS